MLLAAFPGDIRRGTCELFGRASRQEAISGQAEAITAAFLEDIPNKRSKPSVNKWWTFEPSLTA
eukprot:11158516-Lingulodinium_polyedra.AAC.1